jgi:ABC-type multidrug transport system fused ATPase/permease subunit
MIDTKTWKKAWALLEPREKRQAWLVLGVIIIGALSSAVMVGSIMPFLAVLADPSRIENTRVLAWAYSSFGFQSTYGFLVALGLASFAVIVLSSLIQIGKTWAVAHFSTMRMHSISYRLLGVYLAQPYAFFLNRHSGEMGPRILSESSVVVQQFLRPAAEFVAALLTTSAIIGLLVWVEPVVALFAFAILGGIYGAVYLFTRRRISRLGAIRVAANRQRFRMANEALTGIKDIKLLGREHSYQARYAHPSLRMAQTQVVTTILSSVPKMALQAVALGGIILLCLLLITAEDFASGVAVGGVLPVLGVFAFAGQKLMPELGKLYSSLAAMQSGNAAVEAVYEDLVLQGSSAYPINEAPEATGLKDRLDLKNVSFTYPNAERAGVQDISISIKSGEKIGIVGSTGAGKTTLADIVLGLLEPDTGTLTADGTEITSENIRAWMAGVGYVPQDIFLTDAPVSENIALGIEPHKIDEARVRKAAQIAQLDTFILRDLPKGYQTHIGERGVRLSGGQRQRIGIARALYHNADLIVFDEATSALDNLTEAEVMGAIDALPGDKTVLMIAHRLSTVKRCDRIVVMDQGRIVGFDNWEALMAINPAFQRIARLGEAA